MGFKPRNDAASRINIAAGRGRTASATFCHFMLIVVPLLSPLWVDFLASFQADDYAWWFLMRQHASRQLLITTSAHAWYYLWASQIYYDWPQEASARNKRDLGQLMIFTALTIISFTRQILRRARTADAARSWRFLSHSTFRQYIISICILSALVSLTCLLMYVDSIYWLISNTTSPSFSSWEPGLLYRAIFRAHSHDIAQPLLLLLLSIRSLLYLCQALIDT